MELLKRIINRNIDGADLYTVLEIHMYQQLQTKALQAFINDDYELTEALYSLLLSVDQTDKNAYGVRAFAYFKLEKYDQAVLDCLRALNIDDCFLYGWKLLVEIHSKTGDIVKRDLCIEIIAYIEELNRLLDMIVHQ